MSVTIAIELFGPVLGTIFQLIITWNLAECNLEIEHGRCSLAGLAKQHSYIGRFGTVRSQFQGQYPLSIFFFFLWMVSILHPSITDLYQKNIFLLPRIALFVLVPFRVSFQLGDSTSFKVPSLLFPSALRW